MIGDLPNDVGLALDDVLDPSEAVLGAVTTLAGTLVVTAHHVVIVRSGRNYRPQTGVRSWVISSAFDFRYGPPAGGMGRLVVGTGNKAISFFVKQRDRDDAMRLVGLAHGIAHRAA